LLDSPEACARLAAEADELFCLGTPMDFEAVGQGYEDFSQTTDEQVHALLEKSALTLAKVYC
jgi:predicted phosphoribosyltransferase